MKKLIAALFLLSMAQGIQAQEDSTGERRGFKKENLFAGGSVSLSFGNRSFQVGVNPMLGYSLTRWADAGIVVNYIYTSYKDYYTFDDKARQSLYGGGVFTRIFPVRFLFAQGQIEHNFIRFKYIPSNGGQSEVANESATSLLVGAGYTTGRNPGSGGAYGYLSVLWDVMDDEFSPYTDNEGRKLPIIRAGINVPLFQGKSRDW